jgi:hypothetical protein
MRVNDFVEMLFMPKILRWFSESARDVDTVLDTYAGFSRR